MPRTSGTIAQQATPCRSCGRPIEASSARRAALVYCSRGCRRRRVTPLDRALERSLLELLRARSPAGSVCPSEIARALGGATWRELMEPVRRAGRRLAARGEVRFTQRGRTVDAGTARGPVRIAPPRGGGQG